MPSSEAGYHTDEEGSQSSSRARRVVTGKPQFAIAMNQVETLLVSSAGDVLACQCRDAPHQSYRPTQISCQDEMTLVCCEPDDLSAQDAAAGLCGWSSPSRPRPRGGLMGGAPAMAAPHMAPPHMATPPLAPTPPTLALRAHQAFRSSHIRNMHADEDSIVPIRSFDYSHYQDGGNDMLPENSPRASMPTSTTSPAAQITTPSAPLPLPFFYHGIPTFVSAFAQVRMAQVSAHPAGAHVLCISEAGLLYSYGMNHYGQLGIGMESTVYQATPTIVTPLVEHGGKAIQCAAGVDHSLVVVRTEERRLQHKSGDQFDGAVVHHQVYGFGRNDFMKLGLVSPKVKDASVSLPRRVALHAQIAVGEGGILAVAASAEHSAALVRRSTGAMEVYTWGNATHGALGLPRPLAGLDAHESPVQVVPVPSFMAACSSSPMAGSFLHPTEVPIQLSLGPRTTHVVTSRGRLFACGSSDTGVLGTGPQATELAMPREVLLPEHVVSCRAGHSHAVATTSAGRAWAWGLSAYTGLEGREASDEEVVWAPRPLALENVMEAAAGYDATVLVQRDGAVWSWGQATGKLGLGELGKQNVVRKPTRLYGGLRLWRQGVKPAPARRPLLARGVTLG